MSLLDKAGASANVVADGEVEILYVSGTEIKNVMRKNPNFAARFYHSLATTLSRRLRAANEVIQNLK